MNAKFDFRAFAIALFILAVALRLTTHAYNLAAVGALGMLVGCYWSARIGFLFSVAAMAVSDVLGHWLQIPSMGFYEPWLMLTVYGATGVAAIVGKVVGNLERVNPKSLWVGVPAGAIVSAVLFFLVTNTASWMDPQMGYPATATGLISCYVAAIPFAQGTFVGNLLFSALFFGSYKYAISLTTSEAKA
ncbi:MAG: DUF6580 family putative transport protein [Pirellulaceae bacterium]